MLEAMEHQKPVVVVVLDAETGQELERSRPLTDDFVVVTTGNRYLHFTQQMSGGRTVNIWIRTRDEVPPDAAPATTPTPAPEIPT